MLTDVRCCRSRAVGHRQVGGGLSGSGRRMGTSGAESGCGQHSPGDGRGRLVPPTDVGCFGGSATERANRLRDRPRDPSHCRVPPRHVGPARWPSIAPTCSPSRPSTVAPTGCSRDACSPTTDRELRNLVDPDTGQIRGIRMGDHSMPADALVGVGRYATVVADPELSWHSRHCGCSVTLTPATIRSDRPDLAHVGGIAVAPINSRRATNGGASPRGGP